MAKDDYHVIAAKILRYLYDCIKAGLDPDPLKLSAESLGIAQEYRDYVFRNLCEYGYINGVISKRLIGNSKPQVTLKYQNLEITPIGIQYLEENSAINKALEWLALAKDFISLAV